MQCTSQVNPRVQSTPNLHTPRWVRNRPLSLAHPQSAVVCVFGKAAFPDRTRAFTLKASLAGSPWPFALAAQTRASFFHWCVWRRLYARRRNIPLNVMWLIVKRGNSCVTLFRGQRRSMQAANTGSTEPETEETYTNVHTPNPYMHTHATINIYTTVVHTTHTYKRGDKRSNSNWKSSNNTKKKTAKLTQSIKYKSECRGQNGVDPKCRNWLQTSMRRFRHGPAVP